MTYDELNQKYARIPQELRDKRRWCCYKIETRDGASTKIPVNAITGGYASTSDSTTWTSFRLALSGCLKYQFAGLGFMLGEDPDTGVTYVGIDLDNHEDKNTGEKPYKNQDEFEEFAHVFIEKLNSYTEYSHSGEGIHIICKGKLPEGARRKGAVEMYDYRRFFTMSGNAILDEPVKDCSEEIKEIWETYINTEEEIKINAQNQQKTLQMSCTFTESGGVVFEESEVFEIEKTTFLNDYDLIEKIRNSQNGDDFMRLFNGNMTAYNNDHSAADMAMCKILAFWTARDADQMDRIFRQSQLMRDKWDRRWGDSTYGRKTIEEAIRSQRDVYAPAPEKEVIVISEQKAAPEVVTGTSLAPVFDSDEFIKLDEKNDPIVKVKKIEKSYSLTDTGNAERFYDYFGDRFRYDTKAKAFLFWDGKTWVYDSKLFIKKYADMIIDILKLEIKETERRIEELTQEEVEESKELEEDMSERTTRIKTNWSIKQYSDLLKAQRDNLKRVSNKAGKESMISEVQHLHEVVVTTEEFDTQPYLLNTQSAVVDLENEKMLPFDRKYKLSKNTGVAVSFEEPKTWLKFLHDIFERGNEEETQEIINVVQLLLGEALTGRTNKDRIVIMYGNGSNGKSTFIKTVKKCFGEYGKQINPELLLQQKNANAQAMEFSFAGLKGARILIMSETDEGERMSDKTIKRLTSGETISAQQKFGSTFEYDPSFSNFMSTNNLPAIRSKDYGIWRRIYLIPFLVKFTDETKDINMPEKLAKELPQILGWMIKGYWKLKNEHNYVVPKPKCLEEALAVYKSEMDTVNLFIMSNCQNFPGYRTSSASLFANYKKWASDNNEYFMPESKFRNDMIAHGFAHERDANEGWVYVGIKMNSDKRGHDFALDLLEEAE